MKNLSKNLFGIGILSIFATESYSMSNRREKNKPPQNQLNKQLDHEVKEKEKSESQIQLGKFSYSLSGLTYAGVVLAVITDYNVRKAELLFWGVLMMIIFAAVGWIFVERGNIKKIRL